MIANNKSLIHDDHKRNMVFSAGYSVPVYNTQAVFNMEILGGQSADISRGVTVYIIM